MVYCDMCQAAAAGGGGAAGLPGPGAPHNSRGGRGQVSSHWPILCTHLSLVDDMNTEL